MITEDDKSLRISNEGKGSLVVEACQLPEISCEYNQDGVMIISNMNVEKRTSQWDKYLSLDVECTRWITKATEIHPLKFPWGKNPRKYR